MRFLWHFQKMAIKNQNLNPEKEVKVFLQKRKRGINNDMVAILVSCDPKGNKYLQAAARGRISAKAINLVLKDKLEAQNSFMYRQTSQF